MMSVSFQDITLDTGGTDERAVLVMRNGRLTAILSRLGQMHEELAGQWFVETMFGASPNSQQHVFANPDEFVAWLGEQGV
ncbi:hypothetical protein [Sphingomonas sp.]|jgi:hypothetical protein|uniref:hypothetical protein n=1 Tax=Sphingomonas sp. TaxID=28214 RepID=UPI002ED93424